MIKQPDPFGVSCNLTPQSSESLAEVAGMQGTKTSWWEKSRRCPTVESDSLQRSRCQNQNP